MRRKILLATTFVLICGAALQDPVELHSQTHPFVAQTQVVSTVKLKPTEDSAPEFSKGIAGNGGIEIGRDNLAVDEMGDLYLALSITRFSPSENPVLREEPRLVKYDRHGNFVSAFALPDFLFACPGELTYLSSIAIFQDKVYAPANWRDKANLGRIRGSILIYTKDGKYEGAIDTPPDFSPEKVLVLPTGEFFVLGRGPGRGCDMILKLSPTGKVLTSFSPSPQGPDTTNGFQESLHTNYLLLDDAGRLMHVLHDATMRVFDLDGRLLKIMSPALPVGNYLYSVVMYDDMFVLSVVDLDSPQGVYQVVVSAEGKVLSMTEISGALWGIERFTRRYQEGEGFSMTEMFGGSMIKVQGKDGHYYAVSRLGRQRFEHPVFGISKVVMHIPQ